MNSIEQASIWNILKNIPPDNCKSDFRKTTQFLKINKLEIPKKRNKLKFFNYFQYRGAIFSNNISPIIIYAIRITPQQQLN